MKAWAGRNKRACKRKESPRTELSSPEPTRTLCVTYQEVRDPALTKGPAAGVLKWRPDHPVLSEFELNVRSFPFRERTRLL